MRGKPFGWHGKSSVYLQDGEVITFIPTLEMMNWAFHIGSSWFPWWPGGGYAVLTDSEGNVWPLYGFVTKDNLEPASRPEGHWDGRERVGLPMGKTMYLTLHGGRRVKLTYSGTRIN